MAGKSKPYSTRFRKSVANQIEEWREQKEQELGEKLSKAQAIHDLAMIGIESEMGEGTPTERELRRDVEELEDKVDRLDKEREEEVRRLEQEKGDLLAYTVAGAGTVLGVVLLISAFALNSYLGSDVFDILGEVGIAVALISTLVFLLIPVLNRLGLREKVLGV